MNGVLVKEGKVETTCLGIVSIVRGFYEVNDSPLFGHFDFASQAARAPPTIPSADDIWKVLGSMAAEHRLPLVLVWQSGMEISRVLSLRWGQLEGLWRGECPLKLDFAGRKRHKRAYSTFLGRDSVEGLKLWHERWVEIGGREPLPEDLAFVGRELRPVSQEYVSRMFQRTATNPLRI